MIPETIAGRISVPVPLSFLIWQIGVRHSFNLVSLPSGSSRFPTLRREERNISLYCINTNEIPGELSHENMLSSHVKRSPLLWLHNKSRLSQEKKCLTEMALYFIGVYITNRTSHGRWRYEISLRMLKNISRVGAANE